MRVAAGVVLALLFFAALLWTTLRETAYECEVCITFEGRSECARSSAAERGRALDMARNTACAILTSGVTRGLQCQRTPPTRARCDGDG